MKSEPTLREAAQAVIDATADETLSRTELDALEAALAASPAAPVAVEPVAWISRGAAGYFSEVVPADTAAKDELVGLHTATQLHQAVERAREEFRQDAERYRLVRRGQHWSVVDWIGDDLRGEELDKAVDAKRERGTTK